MNNDEIKITDYGIFVLSVEQLISFLKQNNKNKVKKILHLFQKDEELYLRSIKTGTWIPVVRIDSVSYQIKIANHSGSFHKDDWNKINSCGQFNLTVGEDNSVWIGSIGYLLNFEKKEFIDKNILINNTLDGYKLNKALRFELERGKYSVKIEGYKRKKEQEFPTANRGFLFIFTKVDDFEQNNDPREDKYDFNSVNN